MKYCLILCKSLTSAQQADRALNRAGILSYMMRAPSGLTKRGCSYCVRIRMSAAETAAERLRKNGIEFLGFFEDGDGGYQEVQL